MVAIGRVAAAEFSWALSQARPRRIRSRAEFAEAELVIPDGPFKGRRFDFSRQPYTRLLLAEADTGHWRRHFATGPVQSGKTFITSNVPLMYHLFEVGETVIYGLPDMDMAADKWREDILPAIEATEYREYLPTRGGGSRGGTVRAIRFTNGVTLRFMTGGGGDNVRSAFTSRVVVITEVDKMDETGESSREADKITQLEARTRAYGQRACIYGECTVSVEQGRIWQELKAGSDSRIVVPCPYCNLWVSPERDHLQGWQDATDKLGAQELAYFACPECGGKFSEQQRVDANRAGRLVHRGQEITPEGEIVGPMPRTDTLGFRWSAFNNLFLTAGDAGAAEWASRRKTDEENAEREMCQFWWAVPPAPSELDLAKLDADALQNRTRPHTKGIVPPQATVLSGAIDVGKWLLHYCLPAWWPGGSGHLCDYGRGEVPSEHLAEEVAILTGLRQIRERMVAVGPDGTVRHPACVLVDSGYKPDPVYAFVAEAGNGWLASKGYGTSREPRRYSAPKNTSSSVIAIGEGYHVAALKRNRRTVRLVEYDADYWKSWIHARLTTPLDADGSLSFYAGQPHEHLSLSKHLTSERKTEEFEPGKGMIVRWIRERRQNHWLDDLVMAAVAAHIAGLRLLAKVPPPAVKRQVPPEPVRRVAVERESGTARRGIHRSY